MRASRSCRFLPLLLLLAPLAVPGAAQAANPTKLSINCTPKGLSPGTAATCVATVTDAGPVATRVPPAGTVTFAVEGSGSLDPGDGCLLGESGAFSSKCTVTYTPTEIAGGTHKLLGTYNGSEDHGRATAQFQLTVTPANDELESAIRLAVPASVTGTTEGATFNYEDDPGLCSDAYGPVWYSLKPSTSGRLAVRLTVAGLVDSVVAVFAQNRTDMDDLGCEVTDASGVAGIPFDAEAGKTYLVAVAAPWDARVGGFKLETSVVPLVKFPGPRLAHDGNTKLDPLLHPAAAFSLRLREGVTYRINAAAGDACVEATLLAPARKPSEDDVLQRSGECSGYLVYTPGPHAGSLFPLIVRMSEGRARAVHVSVGVAAPDDLAPGLGLGSGEARRGGLAARGGDVVDVYRFEATAVDDATVELASSTLHADLLVLDDRGKRLACACDGLKRGTVVRRLGAGRYFAIVRARPGASGRYSISLRLRAPTATKVRLTRTDGAKPALSVGASVAPAVAAGRVTFEVSRFDPLTGWHFSSAANRRVDHGHVDLALTPVAGRWRVRAVYGRTLASSASRSDWIEFGVGPGTAPAGKKAAACTPGVAASFGLGTLLVECSAAPSGGEASQETVDVPDALDELATSLSAIATLKEPFRSELIGAADSAKAAYDAFSFDESLDSLEELISGLDAAPLRAQLSPKQRSELKAAAGKIRAALRTG